MSSAAPMRIIPFLVLIVGACTPQQDASRSQTETSPPLARQADSRPAKRPGEKNADDQPRQDARPVWRKPFTTWRDAPPRINAEEQLEPDEEEIQFAAYQKSQPGRIIRLPRGYAWFIEMAIAESKKQPPRELEKAKPEVREAYQVAVLFQILPIMQYETELIPDEMIPLLGRLLRNFPNGPFAGVNQSDQANQALLNCTANLGVRAKPLLPELDAIVAKKNRYSLDALRTAKRIRAALNGD